MSANTTLRNVKSPNYDGLPLVTFDLGGHQAIFPLPENCGSVETELAPSSVDPDTFAWIDPENPQRENCLILISGLSWGCYGINNNAWMGSLKLGVGILENRSGKFNFLDKGSFKEWMISRNHEFYGSWNDEIREECSRNNIDFIADELFVYPTTPDDISAIKSNNTTWYREKTGSPKGATHISNSFRTPLNGRFSLNVEFRWSATSESLEVLETEVDELQLEYLHHVRLIPNT